MSIKLLNPGHEKLRGFEGVISATKAIAMLGISPNTFSKELESGWSIYPQAVIEGDARPAYGFVQEYIEEVEKVLPPRKERGSGRVVFGSEVRSKIQKINEKWEKSYPNLKKRPR